MSNDDQGMTHYFTPEQEAMWEEFDRWSATQHEPISPRMAWQACAAQSAETIAKLEEEKRNLILAVGEHVTYRAEQQKTIARLEEENLAWKLTASGLRDRLTEVRGQLEAAQANNAGLRDMLKEIIPFIGYQAHIPHLVEKAERIIAQPLDMTALEAYVAKLIPPGWKVAPIEPFQHMLEHANTAAKAANISICGKLESAEAIERVLMRCMYVAMLDVAPLPPAPDKQGE